MPAACACACMRSPRASARVTEGLLALSDDGWIIGANARGAGACSAWPRSGHRRAHARARAAARHGHAAGPGRRQGGRAPHAVRRHDGSVLWAARRGRPRRAGGAARPRRAARAAQRAGGRRAGRAGHRRPGDARRHRPRAARARQADRAAAAGRVGRRQGGVRARRARQRRAPRRALRRRQLRRAARDADRGRAVRLPRPAPSPAPAATARPGASARRTAARCSSTRSATCRCRCRRGCCACCRTGRCTPLGGGKPVAVDFRLVCATHRNLRDEMDAGRFREDLYYRLNGLTLQLPPLRERSDLARADRAACCARSRPAASCSSRPSWRGVRRATAGPATCASCTTRCAPPARCSTTAKRRSTGRTCPTTWPPTCAARRRRARVVDDAPTCARRPSAPCGRSVQSCAGNLSEAARRLGISRNTLYRKLDELGLR